MLEIFQLFLREFEVSPAGCGFVEFCPGLLPCGDLLVLPVPLYVGDHVVDLALARVPAADVEGLRHAGGETYVLILFGETYVLDVAKFLSTFA